MNYVRTVAILTACSLLAACGHNHDHSIDFGPGIHTFNGSIRASDGQIVLRAGNAPDAAISAGGDLQIDQRPVTVDPAMRDLLKSYYQSAMTVRTDGIDTGKAGAEVGKEAVKSVLSGLSSGNTDQIQQQVEAKAELVKQSALKLCDDLHNIQSAQDQLAAQLPAFQPYGHIVGGDDVGACKSHVMAK